MNQTVITPELVNSAIAFHGHWCPGLAIGLRASEWVLTEMGKAADEEIVAVVETDMCAVDGIQFLTGCTFGKGNLVYRDYGKTAFTFYRRRDGKSTRLITRSEIYGPASDEMTRLTRKMVEEGLTPEEENRWKEARAAASQHILDASLEEIFEFKEPAGPLPRKARILKSMICEDCGEAVMETRTRRMQEKTLCIPCFEAKDKWLQPVLADIRKNHINASRSRATRNRHAMGSI